MSSSNNAIALSEEEKRRILRERRQAKMAKGKASDRLNNILTQGASVKSSTVTSVLDKPESGPATLPTSLHHDDDPEIQDISTIAAGDTSLGEKDPQAEINEMFKSIFQQQSSQDEGNPMTDIFKMFGDANSTGDSNIPPPDSAQSQYEQQLNQYHLYQKQVWRFRFSIVRLITIAAFFFYNYYSIPSFTASNHAYVRDLSEIYPLSGFAQGFFTLEIVIIASYYFILTKNGLFHAARQNNLVMKGVQVVSMFAPQVQQLAPILSRVLEYKELLGIFLGDLSLVVVLFGLLSFRD
ncbi:GET complex subunit [Candida orthopsilosis Co 90-125]|uniref:Golgi to ER traffic protein 2 n=1 Tax=Candida orthopsilosis (strain 90-125) TaxID=1136231 RepID=H8WXS8_CANO9|nr:GET complex subunit [Candida orthopsilosis Co 90-125]CCG20875.1 GET complex subunit [Candida orthopsilosis Co 90-125]